jgi:hypothetical protein
MCTLILIFKVKYIFQVEESNFFPLKPVPAYISVSTVSHYHHCN